MDKIFLHNSNTSPTEDFDPNKDYFTESNVFENLTEVHSDPTAHNAETSKSHVSAKQLSTIVTCSSLAPSTDETTPVVIPKNLMDWSFRY